MGPEQSTPSRILLVDDHPVFREGLSLLIDREADLRVCGEAATVPSALRAVEDLEPDLIVVDISLGDSSGIDLIRQIRTKRAQVPILVVSMHDESLYAERAIRIGAQGYIMKQEASRKIKQAIRRVLMGELYLSDVMALRMNNPVPEEPTNGVSSSPRMLSRLSDRELEVFRLIGSGLGTRQIAVELKLSVPTINSFRARIKEKLKFTNGTELVLHAVNWVQSECRS